MVLSYVYLSRSAPARLAATAAAAAATASAAVAAAAVTAAAAAEEVPVSAAAEQDYNKNDYPKAVAVTEHFFPFLRARRYYFFAALNQARSVAGRAYVSVSDVTGALIIRLKHNMPLRIKPLQ